MKAALIVDWPDLRSYLEESHVAWDLQSIAHQLAQAARADALGSNSRLETLRLYATPATLGVERIQRIWHDAGFQIFSHPGNDAELRDRIVTDCLDLGLTASSNYIILACGLNEYSNLPRTLRPRGVRVAIWKSAGPTQGADEQRSVLEILNVSAQSPQSGRVASVAELSSVLRLLRAEVIERTKTQLRRAARQLSGNIAVTDAFHTLVEVIEHSAFAPTAILAWTDETRHWNGSLIVADRLSGPLKSPVTVAEVREEGESRQVLALPPIASGARLLIVDDAAFTGGTLRMLRAACQKAVPGVELRTAVLSALDPDCAGIDFRAATHLGKDVLFPWGWARSVDQFYDLLRELGTRDRRWMPRTLNGDVLYTQLTEGEPSAVHLLSRALGLPQVPTDDAMESVGTRDADHLIYVIRDTVTISVEDASGAFEPGEFLFIPRVVPYSIVLPGGSELLRLEFRDVQR